MNIIMGASGRVGAAIIQHLLQKKEPVKAVVHNAEKAAHWQQEGVPVAVADAFDTASLQQAFAGGTAVFVLTPETGKSEDMIGDTTTLLSNYAAAIAASGIQKLVGLSSMGAQHGEHSGNLKMSYLLEHAFKNNSLQQLFVRPAYYYSNWMNYAATVKEKGLLPGFYPIDLKIPMIAPEDVAATVADILTDRRDGNRIYEVQGPAWYSTADIAAVFAAVYQREVKPQQLPREQWPASLKAIGFTDDAVKNFIEMTELVISGDTAPEQKGAVQLQTHTSFQQYLQTQS